MKKLNWSMIYILLILGLIWNLHSFEYGVLGYLTWIVMELATIKEKLNE